MSTRYLIAVLPGDGIGPEVTEAAVAVSRLAAERTGVDLRFDSGLIGGAALDAVGSPLPGESIALCRRADAVMLGAVGGPKWDDPTAKQRPELGLLGLRKELGVFANIRPVRSSGVGRSPLRDEVLEGVDLVFVRELTGGLYFGDKQRDDRRAVDTCVYGVDEVERVVRVAAGIASKRSGRLTSVDKANVLETSRLWREVATRVVREEFPSVELRHALVDSMAMHLMTRPADYDVLVTENMFGDILTDEASVLAGSLGLLPSASLSAETRGLYEPVHGSAPDVAGAGVANPCAAILSAAMMFRHSLDNERAATSIEDAVVDTLRAGILPADLGGDAGTKDVTDGVLARLI